VKFLRFLKESIHSKKNAILNSRTRAEAKVTFMKILKKIKNKIMKNKMKMSKGKQTRKIMLLNRLEYLDTKKPNISLKSLSTLNPNKSNLKPVSKKNLKNLNLSLKMSPSIPTLC
jgi:hypothetical protein